MMPAVRSELRKLRGSRSSIVLLAAGIVYSGLNAVATTAFAGRDGNAAIGTAGYTANLLRGGGVAMWIVLLTAIVAVTSEYHHHAIVATYLMTPRRHRVLVAKVATYGVLGGMYAVVSMVVGLGVAIPWFAHHHGSDLAAGSVARTVFGLVTTTMLYGVVGVGVGFLLRRQQTLAAVGAVVWLLAVENVVGAVAGWRVAKWFPGQAAAAAGGSGAGRLLSNSAGSVLFAVYAIAIVGVAAVFTVDRDIV